MHGRKGYGREGKRRKARDHRNILRMSSFHLSTSSSRPELSLFGGDCPLSRAISTTLEKIGTPSLPRSSPRLACPVPLLFLDSVPSSLPPSLRPFPPLSHQAANRTDIQRKVGWSDPLFRLPIPFFARLGRPRRGRTPNDGDETTTVWAGQSSSENGKKGTAGWEGGGEDFPFENVEEGEGGRKFD